METTEQVTISRRPPEEMDLHIEREQRLDQHRRNAEATANAEREHRAVMDHLVLEMAQAIRVLVASKWVPRPDDVERFGQVYLRLDAAIDLAKRASNALWRHSEAPRNG